MHITVHMHQHNCLRHDFIIFSETVSRLNPRNRKKYYCLEHLLSPSQRILTKKEKKHTHTMTTTTWLYNKKEVQCILGQVVLYPNKLYNLLSFAFLKEGYFYLVKLCWPLSFAFLMYCPCMWCFFLCPGCLKSHVLCSFSIFYCLQLLTLIYIHFTV